MNKKTSPCTDGMKFARVAYTVSGPGGACMNNPVPSSCPPSYLSLHLSPPHLLLGGCGLLLTCMRLETHGR